MWQLVWAELRERVATWRAQAFPADEPSVDAWIDRVRLRFDDLVACAHPRPPSVLALDATQLAVFVAMLVQGPRQNDPPEQASVDALLAVVAREVHSPTASQCLEIVTAWGCGWGREIDLHTTAWDRTWPLAVVALRSMVEASVRQTIGMIQGRIDDLERVGRDEIRLYADLIALELAKSHCTCGSHLKSCKDKAGHFCCRPPHKLIHWKPVERSLRSFVAEAVRGLAEDELRSGAYAVSMLYPLLRDDTRLLVGSAEFKVCHTCGEKYEGSHCPNPICRAPDDLHRTRHEARKNWLLIPYDTFDGRGHYDLAERWRCSACACLYPVALAHCPLAHDSEPSSGHGSRTTSVWVYSSRRRTVSRPILKEWLDLVEEELEEAPE